MMEYKAELAVAMEAARQAGQILIDNYANPAGIHRKADGTFVTDADVASSKLISGLLASKFPGYGLLDEEQNDNGSRLQKEYCWVVDPLDNTRDYIDKFPNFGVIIGLLRNLKPVLGVICKPGAKELFYAVKGCGTYCEKSSGITERLAVSNDERISALVSRTRKNPELDKMLDSVNPHQVKIMGGALKVVEIAKGNANLVLSPPSNVLHLWDLCGSSVILEEAGGRMTDIYGQQFDYSQADTTNRNGVLATNGRIHQRVLDSIAAIL